MKTTVLICILIAFGSHLYAQQGWQYQISNLTGNQCGAICSITRDTVCVMSDGGMFLKTTDGGSSWTEHNTGINRSFFDLAFSNSNTGYAAGSKGTILETFNGGATWIPLATGTKADLFSVWIKSPENIWAVGDSGVILNSADGGCTWTKNNTLTGNRLNSICFQNSNTGFIAGNGGILLGTVNSGATWSPVNIATTKDLFSLSATNNYTYLLAGGVFNYDYNSDEVFKSADQINWTSNSIWTSIPGLSRLIFQNDSLGFTIGSELTTNGVSIIIMNKSTDYGQNWYTSFYNWNPPSSVGIAYGDISFATDSVGYALCGNNILKTTDQGTFVSIKELNHQPGFKIFPNPSASNEVSIELTGNMQGLSVEISDMQGMILVKKNNLKRLNLLDVSQTHPGVYFVRLMQDNRIIGVGKLLRCYPGL